jgi:hypothetical protein
MGLLSLDIYFIVSTLQHESSRELSLRESFNISVHCMIGVIMAVGLLIVPGLCGCRPPSPRILLLRLWLWLRFTYIALGVTLIGHKLVPVVSGEVTNWKKYDAFATKTPYYQPGGWFISFMCAGTSLIVCGLLASARNRARMFHLSRRLTRRREEGEQGEMSAAIFAALLGDSSPAHALKMAAHTFLTVRFNLVDEDIFFDSYEPHEDVHKLEDEVGGDDQKGNSGGPTLPNDNAGDYGRGAAVRTPLGEADAFVSHSSGDDPDEKYSALEQWAHDGTQAAGMQALWIDKLCLRMKHTPAAILPLLPIFVAGSKQLLALAGSTLSSRLWCAMEVFTFMQVRRGGQNVTVVPFGGANPVSFFQNFDVRKARCAFDADEQALKAIIESTFGELDAFNAVMRSYGRLVTTS